MSDLAKAHRAELAGARSGSRAMLTEPVDLGELRPRLEAMASTVLPVGALMLLDVRHLGSRVPISRIPYVKDDEKCSPHALTERIASLVQADARQMPGAHQVYAIEAYYGDSHYPSEQARLRVRWDDEEDFGTTHAAASSMGGGEAKLVAKAFSAMTDAAVRLTKTKSIEERETMRLLQDDNRELKEENKTLRREMLEQAKAHQAALNEQHDRELKTERQRELIGAFRRISGVAEALMPVVLSKKFGIEIPIPPHANPIIEQFRQLYERVTADEKTMMAIMQALSHDEAAMVLFGNLMSTLQDRRDLEQARAGMTAAAQAGKLPERASAAGQGA